MIKRKQHLEKKMYHRMQKEYTNPNLHLIFHTKRMKSSGPFLKHSINMTSQNLRSNQDKFRTYVILQRSPLADSVLILDIHSDSLGSLDQRGDFYKKKTKNKHMKDCLVFPNL